MRWQRAPAYPVLMIYIGAWSFIGTLSWTTTAVYFIRDVGMSPLQLVLAGTALWGFGWTFRSGAQDAWLADEVGQDRLGTAYQRGAQVGRVTGLFGIITAVALALADLQLPLVFAGCTALVLAVFIATAMPEHGFVRPERATNRLNAITDTARQGGRLVKATPILLLVLGVFFFLGAWAEGFDRLWEAQLLLEVGLPDVAGLGDVVWFGIFGATTLILSFAVAAPLVKRLENLRGARLAKLLLVMHGVLMLCALGFALAGSLWLAATAYLATTVVRDLTGPPFQAWLNGTITDSSIRATVLSITSIAGSAGEWSGGPALGGVGNRWGVRTALASGAMLLAPTLLLFARAVRHHGVEPELAEARQV